MFIVSVFEEMLRIFSMKYLITNYFCKFKNKTFYFDFHSLFPILTIVTVFFENPPHVLDYNIFSNAITKNLHLKALAYLPPLLTAPQR